MLAYKMSKKTGLHYVAWAGLYLSLLTGGHTAETAL